MSHKKARHRSSTLVAKPDLWREDIENQSTVVTLLAAPTQDSAEKPLRSIGILLEILVIVLIELHSASIILILFTAAPGCQILVYSTLFIAKPRFQALIEGGRSSHSQLVYR